ncbi:hypothetical protein ACFYXM_34370 [Streptomyces sp. NPDC002476]|uniref:hypothetical protein n=1 Tax=Streptomyces sp. NPDC002476 TaxID=3364648 RepID=UPI0036858CEA
MPERYGPWSSLYWVFRRYQREGVWNQALSSAAFSNAPGPRPGRSGPASPPRSMSPWQPSTSPRWRSWCTSTAASTTATCSPKPAATSPSPCAAAAANPAWTSGSWTP